MPYGPTEDKHGHAILPERDDVAQTASGREAIDSLRTESALAVPVNTSTELVMRAAPSVPREVAVAMLLTSKATSSEVAEQLEQFGGLVCSHSMDTMEGVQIATRLLGKGDARLSDLGNGEHLTIDSWLLCGVNTVRDTGESNDFLAVTLGCGERTIRFSSVWARRTLGMALGLFIGRPWEPIIVEVCKRPLTVGQMITLRCIGLANPPAEQERGNAARPSKKNRT
jgi:hypothetical protein